MPTPPQIIDSNGHRVQLGDELGRGGEGAVFKVAGDPTLVAKIYHNPIDSEKVAKLRLLTRVVDKELTSIAAWPTSLLLSTSNHVVGFTMPSASGFKAIYRLYSPVQRQVDFPSVDWAQLVHVTRNAAAAFKVIHERKHVVGDVNQSNIQVSSDGRIKLIDCDSFQVRDGTKVFLCEVGVGHFTPPELQGKPFDSTERSSNHDCFGLAVLIFHILFSGRHPFAGRYKGKGDLPIEQAIEKHLFAYSRKSATPLLLPPPYSLTLQDLSPTLADMFETAFLAKTEPRPTAASWLTALEKFKAEITSCGQYRGHRYYKPLSDCPWCGIVQDGGPDFFITLHIGTIRDIVFDLGQLWREIQEIGEPTQNVPSPIQPKEGTTAIPGYPLPTLFAPPYVATASAANTAIPAHLHRQLGVESAGLATVIASTVAGTWVVAFTHLTFAASACYGTACVGAITAAIASRACVNNREERRKAATTVRTSLAGEMAKIQSIVTEIDAIQTRLTYAFKLLMGATDQVTRAVHSINEYIQKNRVAKWTAWNQRCTERGKRRSQVLATLTQHRQSYEENERQEKKELQRLQDNRRIQQLEDHLRNHPLSEAMIPGIGGGLKRTLISIGIQSAADVDIDKIAQYQGFGPSRRAALENWRQSVENSFRFDPKKGIDPVAEAAVRVKFNAKRSQIVQQLRNGKKTLKEICETSETDASDLRKTMEPTAIALPDGMTQLLQQTKTHAQQADEVFRNVLAQKASTVRQAEDALCAIGPLIEATGIAVLAQRAARPSLLRWLGLRRRVVVGRIYQGRPHRYEIRFACPTCKQYLAADSNDCDCQIACPNCFKPLKVPRPW